MIRSAILVALSASIFSHSSIAWADKQYGSGVSGSEIGIAADDAVQRAARESGQFAAWCWTGANE